MSLKFQIKEEENTKIHNTFIKFQVQIQFAGRNVAAILLNLILSTRIPK